MLHRIRQAWEIVNEVFDSEVEADETLSADAKAISTQRRNYVLDVVRLAKLLSLESRTEKRIGLMLKLYLRPTE